METADAFWKRYIATLPDGHAHRRARLDVFAFGDSPELADELAALVVSGRKRGMTSLPVEFASVGLPLPSVGDVSVVTSGDGRPVAVIELTDVRHVPFGEVDEAFAAEEGEGDGTLGWWRDAHRVYFSRVCARHGAIFDDATAVICQRFRMLFDGHAGKLSCDSLIARRSALDNRFVPSNFPCEVLRAGGSVATGRADINTFHAGAGCR